MSLLTYIERFKFIDSLIRRKATGDTNSFAEKLHLSKSMLHATLRDMKDAGFPIGFCKKSKTELFTTSKNMIAIKQI